MFLKKIIKYKYSFIVVFCYFLLLYVLRTYHVFYSIVLQCIAIGYFFKKKKILIGLLLILFTLLFKFLLTQKTDQFLARGFNSLAKTSDKILDMFIYASFDPQGVKKQLENTHINIPKSAEEDAANDIIIFERNMEGISDTSEENFIINTEDSLNLKTVLSKASQVKKHNKLKYSNESDKIFIQHNEKELLDNKKFKYIFENTVCKVYLTEEKFSNLFKQFYVHLLTDDEDKMYIPF
ncbi:hypothetical protein TUBRATIS_30670, partial [Tubulinosema ratisbonensis]